MKRFGTLLASLLIVASVIVMPQTASAGANSVGVNPRRDYTLDPGQTKNDSLFVDNLDAKEPLTVKLEVIDFSATGQTGDPSLMLGQKEPTKWSLKNYIKLPEQQVIGADKAIEMPFSITIPKNAGAGSYYSAIRYQAVNPETGKNVNISGSAVTLIFVRVSGNTLSALDLKDFGGFVPNANFTDGAYQRVFSASKPKYVSYSLQNKGKVAEQPVGSILIKNIFGAQHQLINNVNPKKNLVLLDQMRRYDVCLNEVTTTKKTERQGQGVEVTECVDPKLAPGRYNVQLALLYGENGTDQKEISSVATIWYLPPWFLLTVAAGLLIIGLGGWRGYKSFQNRNAHKFRGR